MAEALTDLERRFVHTDLEAQKDGSTEQGKVDRDHTRCARSGVSKPFASTHSEVYRRIMQQQTPKIAEEMLGEVTVVQNSLNKLASWARSLLQVRTAKTEVWSNIELKEVIDVMKNEDSARQEGSSREELRLSQEMHQLEAKNRSLLKCQTALETEVQLLHGEIAEKSTEIKKLHQIIIQGGHQSPERSDEDVASLFSALDHKITRTVICHFQGSACKFGDTFNMEIEDRSLLFRSWFACVIMARFFDSKLQPFGLSTPLESEQQKLEEHFRAENVPESDITTWRVATITAATKTDMSWLDEALTPMTRDLFRAASTEVVIENHPACLADMLDLVKCAWQVAVKLRNGKAVYSWCQFVPNEGDSMPENDIDYIPWDVKDPAASLEPRILFGPVYKVVNDDLLLIRKGEILVAN